MELTKRERRKLKLNKLKQQSQESQDEHEQRIERQKQLQEQQNTSKKSKYYFIIAIAGILIVAAVAYSAYSYYKPGPFDDFAKCLTEKGAVIYGAIDWCKYTQAQKAMFGRSFKYINYHDFKELPGIKLTPTWVINGEFYENVQTFEKLSSLTGCKI